jgi:hypothetical protein
MFESIVQSWLLMIQLIGAEIFLVTPEARPMFLPSRNLGG